MTREKFAWTVSVLLLAFMALQIPGSLADRDDDYAFVRTLVDIHRQVSANYVDPVDEDKLREGAIDGMLGQLDPFSNYIPPAHEEEFDRMLDGSFKGVGIQLNQRDDGVIEVVTPIDDSPALKAGVEAGDIIEKVNGDSLEGLRLPDVIKKITGPLGSEVRLTVKHLTGEEVELKMTREEVHVPSVKGFVRNPDESWNFFVSDNPKIAYIRLTQFVPESFEELKKALTPLMAQGMQGLILDLRFNPGGRLDQARDIVNLFIDHGIIVSTKGRNRAEEIYRAKPDGVLPWFPMIVLVNEHSASASEIVSGSLMDNKRALVIGTRTYGKGSVQEVIPLDDKGGELKLTVAYYYLPSGKCVHRLKDATDWGVDPQIVVPMDAAAEDELVKDHYDAELFHRPIAKLTTGPSTAPSTQEAAAATEPATQPALDVQLQRAVDTMTAWVLLQGEKVADAPPATAVPPIAMTITPATGPTGGPAGGPTTGPAGGPATGPAAAPADVTNP
jgi:carboxyl-terminal processing protease